MLRDKGIVEIIKEVETKDIMEEVVKLKVAVRDDTGKYIKRVKDLDNPLPLDCSWFLPFRPNTVTPSKLDVKKPPFKEQIPLTHEEKAKLKEEYYESVKHSAEKTFDSFCTDGVTEILPGKAWVVPNLLSKEECELIIKEGEASGMKYPTEFNQSANVRTSRRTDNWDNQGLSKSVVNRLSEEILSAIEATSPYTSVRGIHPNWRVASYSRGQAFPAHIDQSDSVMVQHPEKVRQRFTSSHTLLIYLSQKEEQFKGGATRLFPAGKYTEGTVDVHLPQGFGLIFQQRGLLHAGLPVKEGHKYIAQAGLLRGEPDYISGQCGVFKYGPGLANPYNER